MGAVFIPSCIRSLSAAALRTAVRSDSVVTGEALRGAGDLGRDPVHHGAASPTTQTVRPPKPDPTRFTTEPDSRPAGAATASAIAPGPAGEGIAKNEKLR